MGFLFVREAVPASFLSPRSQTWALLSGGCGQKVMFIQPLRFTNWQGLRFAGKVISERDGNRIKIELTSPTWGGLKKGDFMHAKCQFSSEAKHVVQDVCLAILFAIFFR